MSIFIFISRIARLTSNLIFMKIYNKVKNNMLFILETFLMLSFCFLLIGNFINNMIGVWIMAIGFFIYLLIRDPFDNYMKKTLFEHSSELVHDKIINYLNLARKVCSLIYSSMVALILLKLNYVYVMSLLLIISIMFMLLIIKINNLVIRGETNELHN